MRLTLKPFGPVEPSLLTYLRQRLDGFDEIVIASEAALPRDGWDRKRDQYRASALEAACEVEPGDRVLGVTMADLFEPPMTFVFGHARIRGREAVISLHRLGEGGAERLRERAAKEAIHEIGHTLGLGHDDANPRCVMHFSSNLLEADRKTADLCPECRAAADLTWRRLRK